MNQPTIIVTGASQGIGAAIASVAASHGANLVLAARSETLLEAQVQKIKQDGGNAIAVVADVSRIEDCQRIVDTAVQVFGRVDALVNNAAIIVQAPDFVEAFGTVEGARLKTAPKGYDREHPAIDLL